MSAIVRERGGGDVFSTIPSKSSIVTDLWAPRIRRSWTNSRGARTMDGGHWGQNRATLDQSWQRLRRLCGPVAASRTSPRPQPRPKTVFDLVYRQRQATLRYTSSQQSRSPPAKHTCIVGKGLGHCGPRVAEWGWVGEVLGGPVHMVAARLRLGTLSCARWKLLGAASCVH